jgi:hypothetical protein
METYKAMSFKQPPIGPHGVCEATNTGSTLEVTGRTNLSNLNYYGQSGAQLIDGVNLYSIGLPVYNSIPDLRNYYSRQGSNASGYSITTGGIYTVQLNMNDRDDIWLIMPGFRLVVYSEFIYTGVILDITNSGTVPIHTYPTSNNLASSCKLYFNGVEIV